MLQPSSLYSYQSKFIAFHLTPKRTISSFLSPFLGGYDQKIAGIAAKHDRMLQILSVDI